MRPACVLVEKVMLAVGQWLLPRLRRELFLAALAEPRDGQFWRPLLFGWAFALCPPTHTPAQLRRAWMRDLVHQTTYGLVKTTEATWQLRTAAQAAKDALEAFREAWGDEPGNSV